MVDSLPVPQDAVCHMSRYRWTMDYRPRTIDLIGFGHVFRHTNDEVCQAFVFLEQLAVVFLAYGSYDHVLYRRSVLFEVPDDALAPQTTMIIGMVSAVVVYKK